MTRSLVGRTVADVERDLILETLKHCFGNRTHAANILGISICTLRNKLNEYLGLMACRSRRLGNGEVAAGGVRFGPACPRARIAADAGMNFVAVRSAPGVRSLRPQAPN